MQPFRLAVPDAVLADLHERLSRARWADEPPGASPWQYGADPAYLRKFVRYWLDEYDWRANEARLNAFPQYTASVGGINQLRFCRGSTGDPKGGTPFVICCDRRPLCVYVFAVAAIASWNSPRILSPTFWRQSATRPSISDTGRRPWMMSETPDSSASCAS